MLILTFNLINHAIVFKFIFGYELRRSKTPLMLGILLLIASYILIGWFAIAIYESTPWILYAIAIILTPFFFEVKIIQAVLLGIIVDLTSLMYSSTAHGIAAISVYGDLEEINGNLLAIISSFTLTALLSCLAVFIKKKIHKINEIIVGIKPYQFLLLIAVLMIFWLSVQNDGDADLRTAIIINALQSVKNSILGIVAVCFFVMIQILILQRSKLKKLNDSNEKCIKEQTLQYKLLSEKNEELRRFKHDYNAHIRVIGEYLKSNNYKELTAYVGQLNQIISESNIISTSNIIADAIFNQYVDAAKKNSIDFSVDGEFPSKMPVSETDLCVILSNAVQNAFEAASLCQDNRKIRATITNANSLVFIEIVNSMAHAPVIVDNHLITTKINDDKHGIGTKNMQETAAKNGGMVSWKFEDGYATTEIIL